MSIFISVLPALCKEIWALQLPIFFYGRKSDFFVYESNNICLRNDIDMKFKDISHQDDIMVDMLLYILFGSVHNIILGESTLFQFT